MRSCVFVTACYMLFDVVIADASVRAGTPLCFKTKLTAAFAKEGAVCLAAFADIDVMEAISAVGAEMLVVIRILNAHGWHFVAIGITLTAVKAKSAKVTDLDGTESISAIRAKMLVPFRAFYTVFSAIASFCICIIPTAEYAKAAMIAKLDTVLVKTFIALLADHTALLAVQVGVGANIISAVAVSALFTVHKLKLPAALAEAAAVAKTAHTVLAEPADTA